MTRYIKGKRYCDAYLLGYGFQVAVDVEADVSVDVDLARAAFLYYR